MKEERDFGGAIFLIAIGVVFLLNTTGVLGWGIWPSILEYWPVILVLWGIKLIIGDSFIANVLMGIISLFVYSAIIALAYVGYTQNNIPFLSDDINTRIKEPIFQTYSREYAEEEMKIEEEKYKDIEKRNIDINVGASEFTLEDNIESQNYISLKSKYVQGHIEPELESSSKNNELNIEFTTKSPKNIFFFRNIYSKFDLELGLTTLLTNLDIELGAGEGLVSLENVSIENVNAKVGAGDLEISLLKNSVPKKMIIEIGAANMDLTIPKDSGFTIEYKVGVGDLNIDNEALVTFASDNTYKSSNFDTATKKIEIVANVGAGSLNIVTK